jgi:uncharacterized protein with von Willebrand factor type A (vWA) domain
VGGSGDWARLVASALDGRTKTVLRRLAALRSTSTRAPDLYFRLGLYKSAFWVQAFYDTPEQYYPLWRAVQKTVYDATAARSRSGRGVFPKNYMAHDAFLLFFEPAPALRYALKERNSAAPLWSALVKGLLRSEKFVRANLVTRGSVSLATVAAASFLLNLLSYEIPRLDEQLRQLAQRARQDAAAREELERALGDAAAALEGKVEEALEKAVEDAEEYGELERELEAAAAAIGGGAGGQGFTKLALSAFSFLAKPDAWRKAVARVVDCARLLREFEGLLPRSTRAAVVRSRGGAVAGTEPMEELEQLKEAVPSELAYLADDRLRPLFAARLFQRDLAVPCRMASYRPVVFVDKSGSMASPLPSAQRGGVPRISAAAALALAIALRYKGDVWLFDAEAEKVSRGEVVETLLTIEADGGTNIDAVIDAMRQYPSDAQFIVISDGITNAGEEHYRWFREAAARRTWLLAIGAAPSYPWVEELRRRRHLVAVRSLEDLRRFARGWRPAGVVA